MPTRREMMTVAGLGAAGVALGGCGGGAQARPAERFAVTMSDDAWKRKLGEQAWAVLRHESTERPYSSPLNSEHRAGVFRCKGCDQSLFSSRTKFESGTGWPSFWAPLPRAVGTKSDRALFMERVEVHCSRCGGHLGHVFDDGPQPTGKRYCMNGVALRFAPART